VRKGWLKLFDGAWGEAVGVDCKLTKLWIIVSGI
jgi:hypothetical protein